MNINSPSSLTPVFDPLNKSMIGFFYKQQKMIMFSYKGASCKFAQIRSSAQPDTLAKLCAGINHFLRWMLDERPDEYEDMCMYILQYQTNIFNERVNLTNEEYTVQRIPLLQKYCQLDSYFTDHICDYVKHNNIENIDENSASTKITLNNVHINILSAVATCIKFCYIYSSMIRGNMKFDDALRYYIDDLIYNVTVSAMKYWEFGEDMTEEDVHNYMDTFIYDLTAKIWNREADTSFKRKFEEVGQDNFYYGLKHKVSVCAAFKKYVPPIVDDETARKYMPEGGNPRSLYYTIGKDYKDFKLVNKNLAKYVQATIRNIITTQDTKIDMVDINIPEFIIDSTEERSTRKDVTFYEDKLRHLFELRKVTIIDLFTHFIDALDEYPIMMNFINEFQINKSHTFNQMILNKCLLSLEGECRVYSELLGIYSKFILLLFYLRVMDNPDLDFMHDKIQIMRMTPSSVSMMTEEQCEEYLSKYKIGDVTPKAFSALIKIYKNDQMQMLVTADDMLDFLSFLDSPARIRNLLFPKIYTDEDDVVEHIKIDPHVYNIMNQAKVMIGD